MRRARLKIFHLAQALAGLVGMCACGVQTPADLSAVANSSAAPGTGEPAARFIFHKDNFTDLSDFVTPQQTATQCLGDLLKTFYVNGADYSGQASIYPTANSFDTLAPTTRPAFIKNVSVDITQTYFPLTQAQQIQSDACSYRGGASQLGPSACADFDEVQSVTPAPTVAPTPTISPAPVTAATPTTSDYYGTKFYRVRDDWCNAQGPVLNAGVEASKTFVGGISIDLDRTKLGQNEDLLMLMTYHALNSASAWPGVQGAADESILEIDLMGTGLGLDLLLGARQPRPWSDHASAQVPTYLRKIETLRDPLGSLRTEQIYLPISQNALIDRIRVERVRGSYHLYQIDLYRLGNRSN